MKPLTIITGIVLGSAASITLGLCVVLLIFALTGLDQPRISDEFGPLAASVGWFALLTAVSAGSFVALIRAHRLQLLAQVAMWATLVVVGYQFWPG